MSATVDVRTKRVNDVISVPIQAVTTRDTSGGMSMKKDKKEFSEESDDVKVTNDKEKIVEEKHDIECVFVADGDKVKLTPVETGIQDNNYIQIKKGLKPGDEVVSAPYNLIARMLKDGDAIQRVNKEKLYSKEGK
jgi:HlyD family secretion protein